MDDFSLLDMFLSMLWFFLFIAWLVLLFSIVGDIIRSRDLSGWTKALWALFIVVVPLLGVLAYLIVRGGGMGERAASRRQEADDAFKAYIRDAAGGASAPTVAEELARLAELRDAGTLSETEFQTQKAKLLA